MSNVIRGTIAELVAKGITSNGVKLGSAELSVLTRIGAPGCRKVGTVSKPQGQKGRIAAIWELDCNLTLALSAGD